MPSMYDIFYITSLEKKLIQLMSSSSIWHEKLEAVMKITPQHLKHYAYLLKNQKWIKINL